MSDERDTDWLTLDQVAEELQCCTRTVYRLIHDGDLAKPFKHLGRSYLTRADVRRYKAKVARGRRKLADPPPCTRRAAT